MLLFLLQCRRIVSQLKSLARNEIPGKSHAIHSGTHRQTGFQRSGCIKRPAIRQKQFLPFRYNVQDGFLRRKRRIRPTSIPLLDEELKHPVIIHYTGGKKPWQYKSQHPYKNLYFRYLDLTEWKGERPQVPFSYRIKQAIDKVLYALRLAKPKYRNIT